MRVFTLWGRAVVIEFRKYRTAEVHKTRTSIRQAFFILLTMIKMNQSKTLIPLYINMYEVY